MAEVVNYEELERLYAEGKYSVVEKKASGLIEKIDNPDPRLLFIKLKALLFSCTPEMIDKELENTSQVEEKIYNSLANIASMYDDCKEVFRIESEFEEAINIWRDKTIVERLERISDNPTHKNFEFYYTAITPFTKMSILVNITLRNLEVVQNAIEKEGVELSELIKKYKPDVKPKMSNEEMCRLEYDTALNIFNQAKQMVQNDCNASADYVQSVIKKVFESFTVAGLLAGHGVPYDDDRFESYHLRHLKLKAEIKDYYLKAKIYPNGKEMYLDKVNRTKKVEELQEIYDRIAEYDSNFRPNVLPQGDPPAQSYSTANSSGGCYVATCVYGSYDCEPVWTLRRYRDEILASTWYGRAFIKTYYAVSPTLVKWFGEADWFKNIFKAKLDKMVSNLQEKGVENTPYIDKKW